MSEHERFTGVFVPRLVKCHPCAHHMRQGGSRIIAEPRFVDKLPCGLGTPARLTPISLAGRHERELRLRDEHVVDCAGGNALFDGSGEVVLCPIGRADQAIGDAPNE